MEKMVIFGAGDTGKEAITACGKEKIDFFIDNSLEKQKNGFEGYEVLTVEEAVMRINGRPVYLAVTKKYETEIRAQLTSAGIKEIRNVSAYIMEHRRNKMLSGKNYIDVYNRAINWIKNNSLKDGGIIVSSIEPILYPEVTGYYIPTLLRYGYKDLAISYAKKLCSIQDVTGGWKDSHGNDLYVFDTAQILKGLVAVREIYNEVDDALIKGADWLVSNINEEGRLITPTMDEWGEDEGICSELIHLYCLSPLVDIGRIFNDSKYEESAKKVYNYYKTNSYDKIVNFCHLSHFHAYLMEAILDMGDLEFAKIAMKNMEKYQKEDGSVPAYNNVDWVCSTGLFQLALVWYRLGNIERADRAFYYACDLQNETGGWFGSYLHLDALQENNTYFPMGEISWANKYFLDALYYKNLSGFELQADSFQEDFIDGNRDGRYQIVENVVSSISSDELTIVDVGCGKGRYLKYLYNGNNRNSYYGIDISQKVLSYITEEHINKKVGSLTNVPLPDKCADIVYTCEALEHAVDIESAIKELVRITKTNGKIIIIDKAKDMLGIFEIEQWEQWFDKKELQEILEKYCSNVDVVESISYDGQEADGVFCAWIGDVN